MTADRSGIGALITGKVFMLEVGAYFPVSMALRGDAFEAVFTTRRAARNRRSNSTWSTGRSTTRRVSPGTSSGCANSSLRCARSSNCVGARRPRPSAEPL